MAPPRSATPATRSRARLSPRRSRGPLPRHGSYPLRGDFPGRFATMFTTRGSGEQSYSTDVTRGCRCAAMARRREPSRRTGNTPRSAAHVEAIEVRDLELEALRLDLVAQPSGRVHV